MVDEDTDEMRDDFADEMKAGITGDASRDASVDTKKFLTFTLKDEDYGIHILKVREIIGYMEVTPVPQTPEFVKGVVNLRGKVIPVINLRSRFGMAETDVTDETCIIVVEVTFETDDESETIQMGIVVDTVEEVQDIPRDNIDPAPNFGGEIDTEYIEGMGKIEENVIILLDINRVLTDEELVALKDVGEQQ
jgi:purine-binding chemotaxis protein CheW